MTLQRVTVGDAEIFAARLLAESINVDPTRPYAFTGEAIRHAIRAGDVLLVDDVVDSDTDSPARVAIWLRRYEKDPMHTIVIPHFWGPQRRVLRLFLEVANLLINRGFTTAKFGNSMPIGEKARTLTGAVLDPADGLWSVGLVQARTRIIAEMQRLAGP